MLAGSEEIGKDVCSLTLPIYPDLDLQLGIRIAQRLHHLTQRSLQICKLQIANLLIYPDLELEIRLAQRLHLLVLRSAQLFTLVQEYVHTGLKDLQKNNFNVCHI